MCFRSLSQLEDNREGVCDLNSAVTLTSGFPFRRGLHNADSFCVKGGINATENLYVGYAAIGLNGELKGNTTLNAVFLCNLRINQAGVNPF